ncbi:MAG: siphovirus Gp157 family protein [Rhodocyclales bacterium]|nr:siphovirus Gp157 family protein [Rhodocyclales bacterium]
MDMPLYRIADDYVAVARQLADLDLPDEVIADTLEGASGDLESKSWNVAALIQQFDGDVSLIKDAEQRMASRRRTLERRVDWLRGYLLVQLLRVGIHEIDSPEFVIRVRDNPPKVILDDETLVPCTYRREEIVLSIRKDEIRKTLLDGQAVPGAHLEREKRLVIK